MKGLGICLGKKEVSMVRIPTKQGGSTNIRPVTPALDSPNVSSRDFGSIQAKQLGDLSGALFKLKDRYDQAVGEENLALANDEISKALGEKVLSRKGRNAFGRTEEGAKIIKEVGDKYSNNPYFNKYFSKYQSSKLNELAKSEADEIAKYSSDAHKASLDVGVKVVTGSSTNEEALNYREDMREAIVNYGKKNGQSENQIAKNYLDFYFASDKGRIVHLIDNFRSDEARDYLDKAAPTLDKTSQDELEKIVKSGEIWKKFVNSAGDRTALTFDDWVRLTPSARQSIRLGIDQINKLGKIKTDKKVFARLEHDILNDTPVRLDEHYHQLSKKDRDYLSGLLNTQQGEGIDVGIINKYRGNVDRAMREVGLDSRDKKDFESIILLKSSLTAEIDLFKSVNKRYPNEREANEIMDRLIIDRNRLPFFVDRRFESLDYEEYNKIPENIVLQIAQELQKVGLPVTVYNIIKYSKSE